jgi:hypothetical protein
LGWSRPQHQELTSVWIKSRGQDQRASAFSPVVWSYAMASTSFTPLV